MRAALWETFEKERVRASFHRIRCWRMRNERWESVQSVRAPEGCSEISQASRVRRRATFRCVATELGVEEEEGKSWSKKSV